MSLKKERIKTRLNYLRLKEEKLAKERQLF